MTEPRIPATPSSRPSSSALATGGSSQGIASSSVRSRSRRLASSGPGQDADLIGHGARSSGLVPAHRLATSSPAGRSDEISVPDNAPGTVAQFLGESWSQGWSSVQGIAGMFLSAGGDSSHNGARSHHRSPSRSRSRGISRNDDMVREHSSSSAGKSSTAWGPTPPLRRSRLDEVAAGSVAEREAALKAARTASVLESHDGVNGGLDVAGRHKRRNSGEDACSNLQPDDCLIYIHHVRPNDTYAGIILRYRCREDVFRRANGLWSRDSIQTHKWLAIPVDACEIRGRPCEPPSPPCRQHTDLLASTPEVSGDRSHDGVEGDDFFDGHDHADATGSRDSSQGESDPWTHVRWVRLESFSQPVQIGRVSRQTLGYFPPRRKKSIRTVSTLSTPRQSSEITSRLPGSGVTHCSPRRQSPVGGRLPPSATTTSLQSYLESDVDDGRPTWMRRPGGVGSMARNIRAPGPDGDYLNSWARRHLPALNIDGLPSMSVMGSDIARFGFSSETLGIVESPFEDGRDAASASRQGTGLDRAAAAVEGWLRGALARRPSTPLIGARTRTSGPSFNDSDLIELADAGSEDGKLPAHDMSSDLLVGEASGRNGGERPVGRKSVATGLGSTRNRQKGD